MEARKAQISGSAAESRSQARHGGDQAEFVRLLAIRDRAAVEKLSESYWKPLLDFGIRLLGNRASAEDLAQEVLLKAIQNAGALKREESLKAWIFRMAANCGLNAMRRKPPLSLAAQVAEPAASAPGPEDEAMKAEAVEVVKRAVSTLPERQRLAVILLRYEHLTYGEIAEALECSVPAVESLIHRAHEELRKKLAGLA